MYCVTVDASYISGEEFVIEWHNVLLKDQAAREFTQLYFERPGWLFHWLGSGWFGQFIAFHGKGKQLQWHMQKVCLTVEMGQTRDN